MIHNIKEHTFYDNFLRKEITVVDLGTCQGEFIAEIENNFTVKKAVLVEANPTNFKTLQEKPNRVLYNKAIDIVDGDFIDFYEDPTSPYNGSKYFTSENGLAHYNNVVHQIETITLETLCKENDIDFIDILKIDVEGAEYAILENISDSILSKIGQITVEFHDFIDPALKPRTEKIIQRMESLGFNRISKPIKWMHDSDHYDVLFYKTPKVGVLYICTGKYVSFLERFLSSANEHLLPFSNKTYYIFTDAKFEGAWDDSIKIIYQPKLGYDAEHAVSKDSLMRYHIFKQHEDLFKDLDYLYFFNANMVFNQTILEEDIFPSDLESGLVSVHHSGHYLQKDSWNGWESNSESVSYIYPQLRTKKYTQGCLVGGKRAAFLEMCDEVIKMIDTDLSNGVYTTSWDEPYVNKYFLDREVRVLHPGYAFPEAYPEQLPNVSQKIIQLDKSKHISYDQLRSN